MVVAIFKLAVGNGFKLLRMCSKNVQPYVKLSEGF